MMKKTTGGLIPKKKNRRPFFITEESLRNLKQDSIDLLYMRAADSVKSGMMATMSSEEIFEYDINDTYLRAHVLKFYNTLTNDKDIEYECEKFLDKIYKRTLERDSMLIYKI